MTHQSSKKAKYPREKHCLTKTAGEYIHNGINNSVDM